MRIGVCRCVSWLWNASHDDDRPKGRVRALAARWRRQSRRDSALRPGRPAPLRRNLASIAARGAYAYDDDHLAVSEDLCLAEIGRPDVVAGGRAWRVEVDGLDVVLKPFLLE
ncbi:MAG: hypothetical protein Q8P18_18615 [Pseudomonadota bacterium]|nr:hypothetical protein [Pseudomonadota bacterium]